MQVRDVIAEARQRLDDESGPFLYPDPMLIRYAAEAEAEACMRADLIYDDTSPQLSTALVQDQDRYRLDSTVWRIDRAWVVLEGQTRRRYLDLVGVDAIDRNLDRSARSGMPYGTGWPCNGPINGRPQELAHIGQGVQVWPKPGETARGTLHLAAYRLPRTPVASLTATFEIAPEHHMGLVDWICFRAFSRKDSEKLDLQRARMCEQAFELRFGARPSANVRRKQNERRRHTTSYGGF